MTNSAPTLPHPLLINGLNHIPPPSASDFDSEFKGLLPPGVSIPSSWGTTRYYSFAPAARPAPARRVILLHGGGTCAIGMAPLALHLTAAGNHVVAYDLWGHGLSSTPLETHTPALLHAQLLELLAHLRWSTAHLLGYSIGGSTAATFAAKHPRVVESVTIVAGAGLLRKGERSWWDGVLLEGGWGLEWFSRRRIMVFVNGSNPQVKPGWKERLLAGEVDTVAVETWERENHKGHVASLVSMFRYGGVYDQHESYKELAGSEVKVLVILGEKDGVIEAGYTKSELLRLDWRGDITVIDGPRMTLVDRMPEKLVIAWFNFGEAWRNRSELTFYEAIRI